MLMYLMKDDSDNDKVYLPFIRVVALTTNYLCCLSLDGNDTLVIRICRIEERFSLHKTERRSAHEKNTVHICLYASETFVKRTRTSHSVY